LILDRAPTYTSKGEAEKLLRLVSLFIKNSIEVSKFIARKQTNKLQKDYKVILNNKDTTQQSSWTQLAEVTCPEVLNFNVTNQNINSMNINIQKNAESFF
jgi:hypothetical protein